MGIRTNFGKFWVPGLILAIIIGGFNWLLSNLNGAILWYFQPPWIWQIFIGILGILTFIFVPWIYGHIIKVIYEKFSLDLY
ncbi:MAG: hypothetical protein ACXVH2_07260 [Methanobacterium sp.]